MHVGTWTSALAAALRACDWRLVLLGALLNLVAGTLASVARWRALLAPPPPASLPDCLSFGQLLRTTCQALLLNNVFPARPGEALRVALLHRGGLAPARIAQVLLGEKAIELVSFSLAVTPAVLIHWHEHGARPRPASLRVLVLGVTVLVLGAAWVVRSRSCWRALWWSCLCDLADLGLILCCLAAVGLGPRWDTAALVYLGLNLALLLPATPGHVGTLEAGAVLALSLLGVAAPLALGFALLYHAAHVLPTSLTGALAFGPGASRFARLPWRRCTGSAAHNLDFQGLDPAEGSG